MTVARAAGVVLSVCGLVSCGSGSNAGIPSRAAADRSAVVPASAGEANGETEIYEADNAFFRDAKQVMALKLRTGDIVRFKNKDDQPHSLYSLSETMPFDLGELKRLESGPVTFDRPGDVEVRCKFHPDMLLMIEVQ